LGFVLLWLDVNNLAFVHHGIFCFSINFCAANATADTKP